MSALRVERVLAQIVDETLARFGGGATYFDRLDESLRRPEFFEALTDEVYALHDILPHIVVTGQFGKAYQKWLAGANHARWPLGVGDVLVLPGHLRHHPTWAMDALMGRHLEPTYTFLDDSYFRGRTYDAVRKALAAKGSYCHDIFVLYDGSHDPNVGYHVNALYTYRYSNPTRTENPS